MVCVGEHDLLPLPPTQGADRSCSQSLSNLGIRTTLSLSLKWLHGASVPPYHHLFPKLCISVNARIPEPCKLWLLGINACEARDYVLVSSAFGEETNPRSPRNWDLPVWGLPDWRLVTPKAKCFLRVNRKDILKAGIFAFERTMENNSCDLIPMCFVYFE